MHEELTSPQPILDEETIAALRELEDGAFLADLLAQYVEQTDRLIVDAAEAVSAGNLASWIGTMHALAGSSRNVGALRFAALCSAAEVDGRSTGRMTGPVSVLAGLEAEYQSLKKEMHLVLQSGAVC